MESVEIQLTRAQRNRMERIKEIKKEAGHFVPNDEELINAAIVLYWMVTTKQRVK